MNTTRESASPILKVGEAILESTAFPLLLRQLLYSDSATFRR
ncbi:unnamed protein product [Brassica rapa subsp. narinosa]